MMIIIDTLRQTIAVNPIVWQQLHSGANSKRIALGPLGVGVVAGF